MENNRYISNLSSWLSIIYVLMIMFLGANVLSYIHIDISKEGALNPRQYFELPVILLALFLSLGRIKFSETEKVFFILTLLIAVFQRVGLDRSAQFGFLIRNVFEPMLLLPLLAAMKNEYILKIRKILVAFLIAEALIAVYEFITNSFVFADSSTLILNGNNIGTFEMRAAALHGHPLQNAFLVSIVMTCIFFSKLKLKYRYLLFFIGWIALTCFNTRSSIALMGIVFAIGLFIDMKKSRMGIAKRFITMILILCLGFLVINFVLSHGMGSRMSIQMSSNDSSSYARFVLLSAFQQLSFTDLLFGATRGTDELIMTKYSLIGIENSFANIILLYGLIFTIVFSICWGKIVWKLSDNKILCIMVLFVSFVLLNANNTVLADSPIMQTIILSTFCFGLTKQSKIPILKK